MSQPTALALAFRRRWRLRRSAAPAPDFLVPRRRPVAAWLLLASGVLLASSVAWDVAVALQDTDAAQAERQTWQARVARRSPSVTALGPDGAASAAATSAAFATVVRALRHPWPALLGGVEAASTPGLQWTVVQHRAGEATVRVEAEVGDAALAVAVVDRLAAQPGWSQVVLTELAPLEGGSNAGSNGSNGNTGTSGNGGNGGSSGLHMAASARFEPGRAGPAARP